MTISMLSMSMPRLTTSVATSTWILRLRNFRITSSLSFCSRSELMDPTLSPALESERAMMEMERFRLEKTITDSSPRSLSRLTSNLGFWSSCTG